MLYCVFNIKKSIEIDSLFTDDIIFIRLKSGKYVISEALYNENKKTINDLGLSFVIRTVPEDQFT